MLRYVRFAHESRIIWIDALCINQADLKERGSQLAIMGSIYRNAIRTVIWLGESDANSEDAVQVLNQMAQRIPPEFVQLQDRSRVRSVVLSVEELSERELDAMTLILSRPWFRRLWVRYTRVESIYIPTQLPALTS